MFLWILNVYLFLLITRWWISFGGRWTACQGSSGKYKHGFSTSVWSWKFVSTSSLFISIWLQVGALTNSVCVCVCVCLRVFYLLFCYIKFIRNLTWLIMLFGCRICTGCNAEIGQGRFLSCLGGVWHPECFRCHACNLPISDYEVQTHSSFIESIAVSVFPYNAAVSTSC